MCRVATNELLCFEPQLRGVFESSNRVRFLSTGDIAPGVVAPGVMNCCAGWLTHRDEIRQPIWPSNAETRSPSESTDAISLFAVWVTVGGLHKHLYDVVQFPVPVAIRWGVGHGHGSRGAHVG